MKIHNKVIKISENIYEYDLHVCIGDYEWWLEYLRKHHGYVHRDQSSYGGETILMSNSDGSYVLSIWMPDMEFTSKDYGTLAHELLHAAFFVMKEIGIQIDADNAEPLNYYFGYLMTETVYRLGQLHRKPSKKARKK